MRSCEENRGWNGRELSKHSAVVADLGAGAMLSFHWLQLGAFNTGTGSDIGVWRQDRLAAHWILQEHGRRTTVGVRVDTFGATLMIPT
jgi:hypothetical protein